jgi:exoribonuclease-2
MNDDQRTSANAQRLMAIAREAMKSRGLAPDFSSEAEQQLRGLDHPADESGVRDLTALLWASIDNDDSMDLDQLSVALPADNGDVRILVAVADVDALVRKGTPIDDHAWTNTTSVYTAAGIFPMLPVKLSTNLTSLADGETRLAIVIVMAVRQDGTVGASDIYRAHVKNRAKLAYDSLAAWLDGTAGAPPKMAAVAGLDDNLRLQDRVAQQLRALRHARGALRLETIEARAVYTNGELSDLLPDEKNRAKELIEDFMVAANEVTARFLEARGFASLRRVLKTPKRWDRIVALAADLGEKLPAAPDAAALDRFLARRRDADPVHFPDLSLSIVKLLGSGEYAVEAPGEEVDGHFGLAVRDYTHSTAPNRRFPDLATQRLVKAALAKAPSPYSRAELETLAQHCTEQEDNAAKVERQVRKSAAAMLLERRLHERFDAIVTGASDKGTYVRIAHPAVEGRVVRGEQGLDVGDAVRVELIRTDVERGHIDFAKVDAR